MPIHRLKRVVVEHRRHALALALLLVCGTLLWNSERGRSMTADEPLHLVRGHALWWTNSTQLSYAHPPLANAITSLRYAGRADDAWGRGRPPIGKRRSGVAAKKEAKWTGPAKATRADVFANLSGWEVGEPLDVAKAYFRHDFRKARAELTGARRVMMLWTLALALGLYVWVERRYDWTAAIVALALFCVHPTLLAHGQLVTTDMPLLATAFASMAATVAWIERPSWSQVALFGLATTAMVLTKHSGLPLTVLLSLIVLGAALVGAGGFRGLGPGRTVRVALVTVQLAWVAVAMIVAIAAFYRFDRVGLTVAELLAEPEPSSWLSRQHELNLLERTPLASLPSWLPIPFPHTWLVGLATIAEQNRSDHAGFFFGPRDLAHPLYFPVLLFAKTPTGLAVLFAASVGFGLGRLRRREWPSVATGVLSIVAIVVLAGACASHINIGIRHVLPLILIMIVFAARAASLLANGASARIGPRGGQAVVLACLLGCGAGAASAYPHWLGDFSLLVGGPTGGHKISVIGEDWGQDVADLGKLAKAQGWRRIFYYTKVPFRREQLESQGLEVEALKCNQRVRSSDPVAIHLAEWVRRPKCFKSLREREPSFVVNHHILVFVE